MRAGTIWSLSDLLDCLVRPDPADDLLGCIVRAQHATRILGALVVSAAAEQGLPPWAARQTLHALERPHVGTWSGVLRRLVPLLADADHPLGGWRDGLARTRHGPGLDQWLTDYESSLRHHGKIPPGAGAEAMRKALAARIDSLCEAATTAIPDVRLSGERMDTEARCGGRTWPVAPWVCLDGGVLRYWEGQRGRKARWTGLKLSPSARAADAIIVLPPVEFPWLEAGSAAMLARQRTSEPLAAFAGDPRPTAVPLPDAPTFWTCTGIAPLPVAEHLADGWRSATRPVIVLATDDCPDPVERLAELLFDPKRRPAVVLDEWARVHGERAVVIAAGRRLSPMELLEIQDAVRGAAVLACCAPAHVHSRWPPEVRRHWTVVPWQQARALPAPVAARIAAGVTMEQAWREAAQETFQIDDAEAIAEFLAVVVGDRGLLDSDRARAWWSAGHLAVAPDGRCVLQHAGWRALAAGLAGHPLADPAEAAWRSGADLAARLARSS